MLVSYLQALYIAIDRPCKEFVGHQIENNTWVCGNTRFILSIENDISQVSTANEWDIMFNTINKSGISKHPCIFLFTI
jgi:hypothetical protein